MFGVFLLKKKIPKLLVLSVFTKYHLHSVVIQLRNSYNLLSKSFRNKPVSVPSTCQFTFWQKIQDISFICGFQQFFFFFHNNYSA